MQRPNVLILYTDQQRWDTVAAAGFPWMRTPNLDRLEREGALLANAFCNSPVCMHSRQSMLSGRYPSAVGCVCNGVDMPPDIPTLASLLKPYGYHTANIGKLHFRSHSNRDHREPHPSYGFDTLILSDEPGCYDDAYIKWVEQHDPSQVENCRCDTPPAWTGAPICKRPREVHQPYVFDGPEHLTHSAFVADETVNYIQTRGRDPFFCIAGFYAPHAPVNPPRRFVEMYDPAALPAPRRNPGEDPRGLGLSDDDWRRVRAFYYALVSHVDDQVGRILDALDKAGIAEQTLVLFTSDHGEHLGDHGLVQKGPPGLDSCAHVPMLLRLPGLVRPEARHEALVEQVDVAPTILDFCGVQSPPFFQGRTFRPLLEGRPYRERASVFMELKVPFSHSWKTVRSHMWKYARRHSGEERLYDLVDDPHELRNVAADPASAAMLHEARAELLRRWFDVESQYPPRTAQY